MGEITDALRRAQKEAETAAPERRERVRERLHPRGPWAHEKEDEAPPARDSLTPEAAAAAALAESECEPFAIPAEGDEASAACVVKVDPSGGAAEAYRHFAIRVRRALSERSLHSVLVTSALRQEGKTTTACNLALALASLGTRVALVDLDLRKPSIAKSLGATPRVGVEEVLSGALPLRSACQPTNLPGLDLYLVRQAEREAHRLLSGGELHRMIRELEQRYELVLFDSPPVLLVPDVPIAAAHVGGVVVVARSGWTRRAAFEAMISTLPPGKVLGAFLNQARLMHTRSYGYYGDEEADPAPASKVQAAGE